MNILAIESSCDETAAAIISGEPFPDTKKQGDHSVKTETTSNTATISIDPPHLLSNVVVSQVDIFKSYGGVIPEVAARSHLEAILPVIHQAFQDAGFTNNLSSTEPKTAASSNNLIASQDDWRKIDAIAVTHTPGLLGSLLIGTLTARTLAILHNKPLYAVHHLKSHIYANWLTNESITPNFPLLALVISGGHTQIIRMTKHNNFSIIGTTHDDAVGECFDKVAKILGLPYPGGPSITTAAKKGNPKKYHLPHPKIQGLDFSFSGLKTAVLRAVQKEVGVPISYPSHELQKLLPAQQIADFAASFQDTACDILLEKLDLALKQYPDTKSIVIAGGVSANQRLREKAIKMFRNQKEETAAKKTAKKSERNLSSAQNLSLFFPEPKFSGDNAAMVGAAAFYEISEKVQPENPYKLNILPRSDIN